jgi:hypothetical protein
MVNNHLHMRHAEKSTYIAFLIYSSYMPRAEARCRITKREIEDVLEEKTEGVRKP